MVVFLKVGFSVDKLSFRVSMVGSAGISSSGKRSLALLRDKDLDLDLLTDEGLIVRLRRVLREEMGRLLLNYLTRYRAWRTASTGTR